MKCHEFKTIIGAEPSSANPDVLAHAETCSACATYRRQMQDMDRLIYKALVIPVDEAAIAAPVGARKRPAMHRWQIAASLVASVTVAASIWIASTRESFAEQIVAHTDHESFSIVRTDERVDEQILADVLRKAGLHLSVDAADVSYASSCPFRGHWVPHLVVQTEEGPVTVLVLTEEKQAKAPERFEEDGYEGVIVPAPRGVLAVLGKDVPVEQAAEKLLGAIQYW